MSFLRLFLAASAVVLAVAPSALANEPFWTQRPDLQLEGNQLHAGNGGWSSYSGPVTKNVYRFVRDGVVVKGPSVVPKTTPPDVLPAGTWPDDATAMYYTLTAEDAGHCFVAEVWGGIRSTYYTQDGKLAYDAWEWGHLNSFGERAVTNQICVGGAPTPPAPPPPPAPPAPPPPPQLVFPFTSLAVGVVGLEYVQQLSVQNGTSPSYAVTQGQLAPGLALSNGGAITGIPTRPGVFEFTVTATDPVAKPVSYRLTLHVTAPTVSLGPQTLRGARANVEWSQQLVAVGGYAPYTFTVSAGTLPDGMTLSPEGLLAGTPDAPAGRYAFTVTATDRYGLTTSLQLVFTVLPPRMVWESAKLPEAVKNRPYRTALVVSGASAPYAFSLVEGRLPAGLVLTRAGELRGRPTRAGLFRFTVQATDANGVVRKRFFGLRVRQAAR